MQPWFAKNDLMLFQKYIDGATNYLEFGCGGSTYQAASKTNIKHVISIESDASWLQQMHKIIGEDFPERLSKLTQLYIDIDTLPNSMGYPRNMRHPRQKQLQRQKFKQYADAIVFVPDSAKNIDLVLIDGRFRVACALRAFNYIDDNCFVIFDDFLTRPYYKIVLDYYVVVEKTEDNRLVILQKKNVDGPSEQTVAFYQQDPR